MGGTPFHAALIVLALLFAGCVQVAAPDEAQGSTLESDPLPIPDPTAVGAHLVERLEYDFGWTVLSDPTPGQTYPARLSGSVHHPTTGDGPFPVVLFMHGRHGTCRLADSWEFLGTHACPEAEPVTTPVDSYTGYDYIAGVLASHGYVVVSVNANHVNDRDLVRDYGAQARAQLLLRTLDRLEDVHAGSGEGAIAEALEGRLDMGRVGLMGHSRGGEGVTKAVTYNHDRAEGEPHEIRAVFALAPTDFNRLVAPDVAFATLLPTCDGDVWTLHGAWMYDDSRYIPEADPAPKIQITAHGANHNFYNTVWTWDDGQWDDAFCGEASESRAEGGRFSAEDQRRHGLALVSAFFRLYVGNETAFEPVFTGAAPVPAEACPGGSQPCPDKLLVSHHPGAPDRLVLEDTLTEEAKRRNDLGGASHLTGFSSVTLCTPPDGCPGKPTTSRAPQLALSWSGPATYALEVPAEHGDVSGFEAVSFRVGVPHDAGNPSHGQDVRVALTDASGRTATVLASEHSAALYTPYGENSAKTVLNTVRIPLTAFEGVDVTQLREVALVFDTTPKGTVQVTDVMFQA